MSEYPSMDWFPETNQKIKQKMDDFRQANELLNSATTPEIEGRMFYTPYGLFKIKNGKAERVEDE